MSAREIKLFGKNKIPLNFKQLFNRNSMWKTIKFTIEFS